MVGYSNEELRQRTAEEITFSDDIEPGRQLARSCLHGTTRYTGDKRYVHKNGEILWVSRTGEYHPESSRATPQHFLLMVEDISERKASEAALEKSRRELQAALDANQLIMDNSQDVICTVERRGTFSERERRLRGALGLQSRRTGGRALHRPRLPKIGRRPKQ